MLEGRFLHKNYSETKGLPGQAKKAIQNGDILFSEIRPGNGRYAVVNLDNPEDYVVSTKFMVIKLDRDVMDDEYFYLQLTSNKTLSEFQKIAESRSGTFPQITFDAISHYPFYAPEKEIQRKVAKSLTSLNNKIELNRQTNQTLEEMAQTLFKSWFVDFDPVFDNLLAKANYQLENLPADFPEELHPKAVTRLAALSGRTPSLDHESERLASGNESENTPLSHPDFPSEFEFNEQLGWVPLGWECSTTGDEFVVKGGSTPSTKNPDFWEGGDVHWTSPKDLSGNDTKIMLDTSRKITDLGLTKITSGLLPVDTVLMSSRAPVGYLALAKVPVAINQGYIAITDAKTLTSEYTIQWLDSVMDEIKSISGGTTFAEISKKTFKSIHLIIPSKEAVEAYTKIAKANYQRITANVEEINTLTETRDYLLPKLISGEIKLENINHD
ncbi:restriction endonuclease subunit S [uncultured Psychromonas sp.]|uniref:restriction endonuclease subunit S n=1 Tax=uncultured Psychromonas sp. TaxID=173974 RepID=UPI0026362123|nr:restriction endonuclease subunit S [uncultured Psychromonas sp.]